MHDELAKHRQTLANNTRDCIDGCMLAVGTVVLVNPGYPEDVRADTQENRKKFQEYNFIWREENRYDLVKQAIDKMYGQGHGKPGQESIRVEYITKETGFTSEEVEKQFCSLERKEGYATYKTETDKGDLAIRRPEK